MLPRGERLVRRRDFSAVYNRKKSWANALLVLYVRRHDANPENAETRRFGFSVSKKVGKAHERNRIKRRLREVCRALRERLRHGFDAVFVVRTAASAADFVQLGEAALDLCQRASLMRRSPKRGEAVPVTSDATGDRAEGSFPAEPDSEGRTT